MNHGPWRVKLRRRVLGLGCARHVRARCPGVRDGVSGLNVMGDLLIYMLTVVPENV